VKSPDVSVIIPVFNRAALLSRAIKSALVEDGFDLEVIVVDDGSTDNIASVTKPFGARVKLISQINSGSSAARNRGLDEAHGKYIRFLDSDDWLLPGVNSLQVKHLESSGADICFGDWREACDAPKDGVEHSKLHSLAPIDDPVTALLGSKWCPTFCYLLPRQVVDKIGGWPRDVSLGPTDDLAFVLALALEKFTFTHFPLDIGRYYQHAGTRLSRKSLVVWSQAALTIYRSATTTLDARSGWTETRRLAIAASLLRLAKIFFGLDKLRFRECISLLSRVSPGYRPPGRIYSKLVDAFGYERAESLLEIRRRMRRRFHPPY
jgi:glycosyltransferase involved in cell wall biosynthesis